MMYIRISIISWISLVLPINSQVRSANFINHHEPIRERELPLPIVLRALNLTPLTNPRRESPWMRNLRSILPGNNLQNRFLPIYPSFRHNNILRQESHRNPRIRDDSAMKSHINSNKEDDSDDSEIKNPNRHHQENGQQENHKKNKHRNKKLKKNMIKDGKSRRMIRDRKHRSDERSSNKKPTKIQGSEKHRSSSKERKLYLKVPEKFMEPPKSTNGDYQMYRRAGENPKRESNHDKESDEEVEKENPLQKDSDERISNGSQDPENESVELEGSAESKEEDKKKEKDENILYSPVISPDGDRVDFQIQGHAGPNTYLFGFDTGDGNNRQYRLEEKLKDGTVKGKYGYYDARGKLRAVKYIAKPSKGYEEKYEELGAPESPTEAKKSQV